MSAAAAPAAAAPGPMPAPAPPAPSASASASASGSPSPPSHLLSPYTHVGFDLDHTLARYRLGAFSPFLFGLLRDFLVEQRGWPGSLRRVAFAEAGTHKALLWDAHTGNCVKLGADKRVLAASHGCILPDDFDSAPSDAASTAATSVAPLPRMLSPSEVRRLYPHPITDWTGGRHPRWHAFYTFFEMPGVPLVAAMVELTDRGMLHTADAAPASTEGRSEAHPYGHIFPAIGAAYEFHLASPHRGGYFPAFRADPGRFLWPRPEVTRWLRRLRAGDPSTGEPGRFLFLCTNSKYDYTELLCRFSFGDDWTALFDLVIVDAKKPGWFMAQGQGPAEVVRPLLPKNNRPAAAVEPSAPIASATAATAATPATVASAVPSVASSALAPAAPRPFYFLDPVTQSADLSRPPATLQDLAVPHSLFVHGNAPMLSELFEHLRTQGRSDADATAAAASGSDVSPPPPPPSVIYFGDHLHTDCMATRQYTSWAAGAVVEEIESWHHHEHEASGNGGEGNCCAEARVARAKHETFHQLHEIISNGSNGSAAPAAPSKVSTTSAFGSFFHHHHPPAPTPPDSSSAAAAAVTSDPCADVTACAAAVAECAEANGACAEVEWTYWHRVLSLHCDVVVGCLTDCIPVGQVQKDVTQEANGNGIAPAAAAPTDAAATSSPPSSALSSASAAATPSSPSVPASASSFPGYVGPRLTSSCIHPPTLVRFQPPALGGGSFQGKGETPAQRGDAAAKAKAKDTGTDTTAGEQQLTHPRPPVTTLQYSIHRVPPGVKAELRAIFPELSSWPAAGSGPGSDSGPPPPTLTAAQFKSLPLLCVPTFQPSRLPMVSFAPEVEHEKNRLLECFDAWARGVCVRLRARGLWADLVEPCSGYPSLGAHGSGVYSEVDAAAVFLSYRMEQVGTCAVITHPLWGLAHYPASVLTTASPEQLQRAIEQVQQEMRPEEEGEEGTKGQ